MISSSSATHCSEQIFQRLIGRWKQVRSIVPGGNFTGIATFKNEGDNTLRYHEEGTATLDDGTLVPGFRDYVFRLESNAITVYFNEKPLRLFHQFRPAPQSDGTLFAETFHRCVNDDYSSTYRFMDDNQFQVVHRVSGPRKSYVMTTFYSKL